MRWMDASLTGGAGMDTVLPPCGSEDVYVPTGLSEGPVAWHDLIVAQSRCTGRRDLCGPVPVWMDLFRGQQKEASFVCCMMGVCVRAATRSDQRRSFGVSLSVGVADLSDCYKTIYLRRSTECIICVKTLTGREWVRALSLHVIDQVIRVTCEICC